MVSHVALAYTGDKHSLSTSYLFFVQISAQYCVFLVVR